MARKPGKKPPRASSRSATASAAPDAQDVARNFGRAAGLAQRAGDSEGCVFQRESFRAWLKALDASRRLTEMERDDFNFLFARHFQLAMADSGDNR